MKDLTRPRNQDPIQSWRINRWIMRQPGPIQAIRNFVQNDLNNRKSPLSSSSMQPASDRSSHELDPLERQVVAVFVDGVRVLGLPRSIGEIYGLLFISRSPLSLDDLVKRLDISKGSASQGLRLLKSLGAVIEANGSNGETERRTYYEPAVELKRLVGGFIREQIRPHLESGKTKINQLAARVREVEDPESRKFLSERVDRLGHWMRSGGKILPILQKILGQ
jgi:DNA-binding transcriptional regulator GbsR (MarR family)